MASSYSTYTQPFFDTLAQGTQVAQSLRQAALQQQQIDEAKRAAMADEALRQQQQTTQQNQDLATMLQNGGKVVDPSGNVQATAPTPTLTSDPSSGAGSISPDGTLQMNPNQTGLMQSLTNAGGAQVPVQADQSQTVSMGGRQVQVATPQNLTDQQVNLKQQLENADRIPISDKLADSIGVPRGTKLSPEHLAGVGALARYLNPPQQASGPSVLKTEITKDDKGNQTAVNVLDNGQVQEIPLKAKGPSDKFGNPEVEAANTNARALTANGQMTAANQAMKSFHDYEGQEMQLRQQLDRIDHAVQTGGMYTVKVDDKGSSTLQRVKPGDDGTTDPNTVLSDLQSQRNNVGARLQQVLTNKYDAGDQYGMLTTGKPTIWGVAKQKALTDLQARLGGQQQAQAPAAAQQPAPPAAAAAAPAAAPGAPAPVKPPSSPKVATRAQVQQYADAKSKQTGKKITISQGLLDFKAMGYQVQ